MPDTEFKHLEDSVRAVKSLGLKVSVDSADNDELIRGGNAGADYILSISENNKHILDKIKSTPILIPAKQGSLKSLERIVELMIKKKKKIF